MCPYNVSAAPASFETSLVWSIEVVDFVSGAAYGDDRQNNSYAIQQDYRRRLVGGPGDFFGLSRVISVPSPSVSIGTWCSNDELMILASERETIFL